MLRPAPRAVRVVGWLLTPLVVWAASFLGGWLGATLGPHLPSRFGGVEWMVGGAVLVGITGLALWTHRLRRGRRRAAEAAQRAAAATQQDPGP